MNLEKIPPHTHIENSHENTKKKADLINIDLKKRRNSHQNGNNNKSTHAKKTTTTKTKTYFNEIKE